MVRRAHRRAAPLLRHAVRGRRRPRRLRARAHRGPQGGGVDRRLDRARPRGGLGRGRRPPRHKAGERPPLPGPVEGRGLRPRPARRGRGEGQGRAADRRHALLHASRAVGGRERGRAHRPLRARGHALLAPRARQVPVRRAAGLEAARLPQGPHGREAAADPRSRPRPPRAVRPARHAAPREGPGGPASVGGRRRGRAGRDRRFEEATDHRRAGCSPRSRGRAVRWPRGRARGLRAGARGGAPGEGSRPRLHRPARDREDEPPRGARAARPGRGRARRPREGARAGAARVPRAGARSRPRSRRPGNAGRSLPDRRRRSREAPRVGGAPLGERRHQGLAPGPRGPPPRSRGAGVPAAPSDGPGARRFRQGAGGLDSCRRPRGRPPAGRFRDAGLRHGARGRDGRGADRPRRHGARRQRAQRSRRDAPALRARAPERDRDRRRRVRGLRRAPGAPARPEQAPRGARRAGAGDPGRPRRRGARGSRERDGQGKRLRRPRGRHAGRPRARREAARRALGARGSSGPDRVPRPGVRLEFGGFAPGPPRGAPPLGLP